MKSLHSFVVKPHGSRYSNTKSIGNKQLILNTEVYNHQFTNRTAEVVSTPSASSSLGISPGDKIIVHHNVFRRWHDIKGKEKNSKSFFNEDTYIVSLDQIFLVEQGNSWRSTEGFCFVQPIKDNNNLTTETEKPLMGIIKYTDGSVEVGDLVGFTPSSQYEFIIDGQRLYRVYNKFITIKYEYQGNEEEYNPSWA